MYTGRGRVGRILLGGNGVGNWGDLANCGLEKKDGGIGGCMKPELAEGRASGGVWRKGSLGRLEDIKKSLEVAVKSP